MSGYTIKDFKTWDECWQALPPKMRECLIEIDDGGSFAGGWCGVRGRTLERLQDVGAYSDVPALVATARNGTLTTTPFGHQVARHGRIDKVL